MHTLKLTYSASEWVEVPLVDEVELLLAVTRVKRLEQAMESLHQVLKEVKHR